MYKSFKYSCIVVAAIIEMKGIECTMKSHEVKENMIKLHSSDNIVESIYLNIIMRTIKILITQFGLMKY